VPAQASTSIPFDASFLILLCKKRIQDDSDMRTKNLFSALFCGALVLCAIFVSPCISAAETVTYYYTNEQGTPLATTDAAGNIITLTDYHPYGAVAVGAVANGPGFGGHLSDQDSGLVYMQHRFYDPESTRFVSIDPAPFEVGDISALNRYIYGKDNPLSYVDLEGEEPSQVHVGFGLADEDSGGSQPPPPPPPQPPVPPSGTQPVVVVTATAPPNLPPPIFRAPEGRPIFKTPWLRVAAKYADDYASRAVVKRLSFKALTISKAGRLVASPYMFGAYIVFHIEGLGGCSKGRCADEAPPPELRDVPPQIK
jgi:RHS repeat-associated protein